MREHRQKWRVGYIPPAGELRERYHITANTTSTLTLCPIRPPEPWQPGFPLQAETGKVFSAESELLRKSGLKVLTSGVPQPNAPAAGPQGLSQLMSSPSFQ